MTYSFNIEPAAYIPLEDESAVLDKCKEWGLLSEKATKLKAFTYKRNRVHLNCTIVGYVDQATAVIEFDNQQKHCIHPSYLKEMQAASFSQRLTSGAEEEAADPEKADTAKPAPAEEPSEVKNEEKQAAAAKPPAVSKKEKASKKVQLPEEKVKITATVQEFTTVPNHFSDTDDEVVIYEAVAVTEPSLDLGTAWSSYSATLKKLELNVGDTLTFEAKVVAKKLTKHPVPYKINNPARIQVQNEATS